MKTRCLRMILLAGAVLVVAPGCSLFGSSKLENCQAESERLLADYRLERERADRLAVQNRAMTDRVADLERRLAVIHDAIDQRLATRSDGGSFESSASVQSPFVGPPLPTTFPSSAASSSTVPPPDPWRASPR